MPGERAPSEAALTDAVRHEVGPIVAYLHRLTGDFDVAEEAVQDALVSAVTAWRRDGPPPNPAAWLTLAARRKAVDRLRREAARGRLAAAASAQRVEAGSDEGTTTGWPVPDERVAMLFGCCHPALALEARLALTLRSVVGLTTEQLARAFLVPEATLAQRIVRAKRKIVATGIRMEVPTRPSQSGSTTCSRSSTSLTTPASSTPPQGRWRRMPAGSRSCSPPACRRSRRRGACWPSSRCSSPGRAPGSDRTASWCCWPTRTVRPGTTPRSPGPRRFLERAAVWRRPGRFQLQAAFAACHAAAPTYGETDWLQILTLYDLLVRYDRSPVICLNRAVALAECVGVAAALEEVDAVAAQIDAYHLLHATRADLLGRLGRHDEAATAIRRALDLVALPAERTLLADRLAGLTRR